ncbi:hypothetical protein B566_EDAN009647 [Ephemera danica]|nr:hypothetical protein B566_EDAN009647 [Ephemera danica]
MSVSIGGTISRRREEARVIEALQRRLAAVAEERQVVAPEVTPLVVDTRPQLLLAKLLRNRKPLEKDASWSQLDTDWGDSEFISDCLRWHNQLRQKHGAAPLLLSSQLCAYAQAWANHLAHTNTFCYRNDRQVGQNLFCRPVGALQADIPGRDVALHWYASMKQYDFFKEPNRLHANVNAGHFTQLVWASTKQLGLGKARSRAGRVIVVANYHPPGNVSGAYQRNVRPPLPGSELRFDLSVVHAHSESVSGYSLASSSSLDSDDDSSSIVSGDKPLHIGHLHMTDRNI